MKEPEDGQRESGPLGSAASVGLGGLELTDSVMLLQVTKKVETVNFSCSFVMICLLLKPGTFIPRCI